jgi:hypothetical protein
MAFNPEIHQIKLIIIKCGEELRKARGLPEEKNITTLYEEASSILGIPTIQTTTQDADHLPAPHEMKKEDGMPMIPLRKCPKCEKDAMQIFGLCPDCEDSEGGKYETKFECSECHYSEKSEKHMVLWLQEMGVDFGNQSKKELGIKTITDEGLK